MRVEREDEEIELYCQSKGKEATETAITQRVSTRLEQALQDLADGLDKPRRLKNAKKVCETIGGLRQNYSRASKHYEIEVEHEESAGYPRQLGERSHYPE